jgi:hypothetical protein
VENAPIDWDLASFFPPGMVLDPPLATSSGLMCGSIRLLIGLMLLTEMQRNRELLAGTIQEESRRRK